DLLEAAREGSAREVRRLLEAAANPNAADADGRTALHWAAIYGRADSLQELLRCGGNANCRSHRSVRGFTPLHEASLRGHPACVALLVDGGGADCEARDDTGWTPLHLAATRGHEATVQALLARGASPLARNIWGKRPADIHPNSNIMVSSVCLLQNHRTHALSRLMHVRVSTVRIIR
ncbi:Tyrosine-protein kinase, partial [Gryllus bimaculatus]